jgi:hypothetical protein
MEKTKTQKDNNVETTPALPAGPTPVPDLDHLALTLF